MDALDTVAPHILQMTHAIVYPETIVAIEGMSCASCVRRVERAIAAVPGVVAAVVNLATERATIQGVANPAALEAAISKAGYTSRVLAADKPDDTRTAAKDEDEKGLLRDLSIAALFTTPVFALEMGGHILPAFHMAMARIAGETGLRVFAFALTTIVLFGPGLRFYAKGLPALWRLSPDMNSLVVLGATAAWGFSSISTFAPGLLPAGASNVYFEAAAMIVTLILLGRLLEARAKGRAGDAIGRLIGLRATTARIERNGAFVDVPMDEVAVGDLIRVRPGERVAVDGTLASGTSFVDESAVTGEPSPVRKETGAGVTGGTMNTTGSFVFRADKVGADTMLAHIIRMVETAQGAKLPIQAVVDRVTQWFVPAVLVASVSTFLGWLAFGPQPALGLALVNAVSVLIIACPCAMGLATPVSIMVGSGRAAQLGVLFRKGEALQTLRDVSVIAFDKTGTLTHGRPMLTDVDLLPGYSRVQVLALVAAVEARSEHPIASALLEAAKSAGIAIGEAREFEALPGHGVRARVGDRTIGVGTARMMRDAGVDTTPFGPTAERLAEDSKTPLYVCVDGRLAAILAVADPIKASAAPALAALQRLGLRVAMMTGDTQTTAAAVASSLDIRDVVAGVLPDGKAAAVKALRAKGRIAFVGDGINDAPALAEADVGIAIGTGTDVAIETADVVLMSGDLAGVATAISLSRATIRNIRQNLAWAFGYNVVLIPVAAGVLYPITGTTFSPMLAAGAMALSSVFVLVNALRLRGIEPA